MKKQIINVLIVVISVALIGLIGMQLYWIDNAISLKEDEFEKNVNTALYNVVNTLERRELVEKIKSSRRRSQLMGNHRAAIQRKLLRMNRNTNGLDTINRIDVNGVEIEVVRSTNLDSVSNTFSSRIATRNEKEGSSSYFQMDVSVNDKQGGNKRIIRELKELEKRSDENALFDNIMSDLFEISFRNALEARIHPSELDSLIREELARRFIKTEFRSGVFDFFGRGVEAFTNEKDDEKLRQSNFKVKLFPNDFIAEPHYLSVVFPHQKGYLLRSMSTMLILSILFVTLIIGTFSYTIHTIIRQKKLSLIKTDFINNMTHELKTPISTISLACQALTDKDIKTSEPQKERYVQMIDQENKRLALMVENVLKSAIWDKEDFQLDWEPIDLNAIIENIADNILLQLKERQGKIELKLDATQAVIQGDKVHVTNIVYNLLDNAIKYSLKDPQIEIRTWNDESGIRLSVKDNGVGISKEHQRKIFDKFYRIPTGNLHDVKGFGLGLNYVHAIVTKHNGAIAVESSPGKGSKFELYLPFDPLSEHHGN
jgi:two-component system phosphate regulon sensor histidine kinase PhoR